jgi:hypothetical protein
MEVPRTMLVISGKWPGDGFVDERHSAPPQVARAPYSPTRCHPPPPQGDALNANLGRLPICITEDGQAIGQSAAINYYIASQCGNPCRLHRRSPASTAKHRLGSPRGER